MLGKYRELQLDSADIFSKKNYAGGKLALLVDNRNKEFFPTRGLYWYTEVTGATGISKGSDGYVKYTTDMAIYASFRDPANLVAILKFGGGRIFSKNFEYFQALSIGANSNLNGFRKNRFSGNSTLYTGIELKIKLADVNSFILPGSFGITGFYDLGRVWVKGEQSGKWHGAFGGGLYYMPFNIFAINATAGFSDGEKMLNFTLGTKINLTY